ncbi:MAG: CPBP family intramembrane glutamic endopeptidase [Candidatus Fermentibacteria bacterium]|nr:CPBP family intramembrane glutamic endopeptidase [Candidatus Fermentibacteria bacterium]
MIRFREVLGSSGYNPSEKYFYILLISAPVLLTVYRYFAEAQNFLIYFPGLNDIAHGDVYAYLLEYLSVFVLMLLLPLLTAVAFGRSKVLYTLFSFNGFRKSFLWVLLAIAVIVVPSAYHASTLPSVQAEYPLPGTLMLNQQMLITYFTGLFFLYYLPWEFFFRGFLLFGLKEKFGTVPAILIQTISSCLVHIGKPTPEIIGSIPFGIVFGIIAVRTKNIWIVVLLHAALGIFTDLFIIYQG